MDTSLLRPTLPTLAIVVASLAALASLLSSPRIDRLARLRTEREQLTKQVALWEEAAPNSNFVVASHSGEIAALVAELQSLNAAIADPNTSYDALADLIRRSGLEVESAAPGRVEMVDERVEVFGWNVVAVGSFGDAVSLLDSLHELPGLVRMASMRLGPAPAGKRPGDLVLHLNIEFVRILLPDHLVDAASGAMLEVKP